jgi:transposase
MRLGGIGEITATAMVAMIGNGHDFRCGRQCAAWIGLVPGPYSYGGKNRLGRITKAGDPYLHSLLVLGARAVLNSAANKTDGDLSRWAIAIRQTSRLLARHHRHRRQECSSVPGGSASAGALPCPPEPITPPQLDPLRKTTASFPSPFDRIG